MPSIKIREMEMGGVMIQTPTDDYDGMTTDEMQEKYEVLGFGHGYVACRRRSDDKLGSLEFIHEPRFYYNFRLHDA